MDTIDINGLADLINNEGVNFIGSAITPLHAHGVDCCVRKLQDQGVKVKGVALINAHSSSYFINESHFSSDTLAIYKYDHTHDFSLRNYIRSIYYRFRHSNIVNIQTEGCIYLASAWHLDYKYALFRRLLPSSNFSFLLFEEGLATYFPVNKTLLYSWRNTKRHPNPLKRVVGFCFEIFSARIDRLFESKIPYCNLNLLLSEKNKLLPNSNSICYYKEIFRHRSKNRVVDFSCFENCAIICTMAYPRHEIKNNSDVTMLKHLVQALQRECIPVILKPHPREVDYRERYADIGCLIYDDKEVSMEMIMTNTSKIHSIISFSSTALVTAKVIFDVRAISILNILNMDDYSNRVRDEMLSFASVFGSLINMPNSLDEIFTQ